MVKEWVRDACNEVRAKAYYRIEIEKALEALKQEHMELENKLIAKERVRNLEKRGDPSRGPV